MLLSAGEPKHRRAKIQPWTAAPAAGPFSCSPSALTLPKGWDQGLSLVPACPALETSDTSLLVQSSSSVTLVPQHVRTGDQLQLPP